MSIRQKINSSFVLLGLFIIVIGTISLVSLYQIEEDASFGRKISSLIKLQEEMNEAINRTIDEKKSDALIGYKELFEDYEKRFERLREKINKKEEQDFLDIFLRDIHNQSHIDDSLKKLYDNEHTIEVIFEDIYEQQKDKLQKVASFNALYPSENSKRKNLEHIIYQSQKLHLVQAFGDMKYYSKETLYQHKSQKYLNQWLQSIDAIIKALNQKSDISLITLFKEYKEVVVQIGTLAIEINTIEQKALQEINRLNDLLHQNREESALIEQKIASLIEEYLNTILIIQFILVLVIIVTTVSLTVKISSKLQLIIAKLNTGAKQLQQGNYSQSIVLKDSEFSNVATTFNQMAHSIKEHQENLEEKIEQRTHDLKVALQEVQTQKTMMENLSSKLSKYLSPQLYESIFSGKQDVDLSSQRKYLTVFFSDIKGFTSLTDTLETETLTQILNEYLDAMSEIAIKHGGTIDKYIGDCVMVFFGDPNSLGKVEDATACVNMAIEMKHKMHQLKIKWNKEGISNPFEIRMGINSGYCTVGNFGSKNRMDYTIVGGVVNLASRLESNANANTILISEETYTLVKTSIEASKKEQITVKGMLHPVQTYEVESNMASNSMVIEQKGLDLMIDFNEIDKNEVAIILEEKLRELKL